MRNYLEGCTLTAFQRGSRVLAVKVKSKIGYRPRWKHAGGAAAAAYFLWPIVGPVLPTVLTVTAMVWFVAAMAIGASQAGMKTAGSPGAEQPDDEPDEELQDPPADAALYELIRQVAKRSDQGTAAHLPDLLDEGRRRGLFGGWEQADLKAHLTALGAPLVEGKKLTFGGLQRNRQAVLLDGLPEAAPAPAREAAGAAAGWPPEPAPPAAPGVPSGATGSR